MKNRVISILLICLLCIMAVGCSQEGAPENVDTEQKNNQAPEAGETVDSGEADTDSTPEGTVIGSSSNSYPDYTEEEMFERADIVFIGEFTGNVTVTDVDKDYAGFYTSEKYNDHQFRVVEMKKGETAEYVTVRLSATVYDGNVIELGSDIVFEQGKKYLMYMHEGKKMHENDVENYYLLTGRASMFEQ